MEGEKVLNQNGEEIGTCKYAHEELSEGAVSFGYKCSKGDTFVFVNEDSKEVRNPIDEIIGTITGDCNVAHGSVLAGVAYAFLK